MLGKEKHERNWLACSGRLAIWVPFIFSVTIDHHPEASKKLIHVQACMW
jgi:hypothetical protein